MKGATSKGAAKPDTKLAVKSKGAAAKGRKAKPAKDPNKPKRAPSAFFVFMAEFRKEFNEKNPKNKSVAADKAPYVAKANKLKGEYNKAIAAYNKGESTAAATKKAAPAAKEEDDDEEESDKSKSEINDDDDDEGSDEDDDDDE